MSRPSPQSLGHRRVRLVGHDIGLMVAYAYAAQFPAEVERIALMDAFLPGVGEWQTVWLLRDLWHFHFYGEVPLQLVAGRERIYFEHFWNDFAADRTRSVPEADRRLYAAAYAEPGGMRAGFEIFRAFEQDAADFAQLARKKLPMPMLVLTGEKASGEFLIQQGRLVADQVEGVVIKGAGHWLMDEAPGPGHPEAPGLPQRLKPCRAFCDSHSIAPEPTEDIRLIRVIVTQRPDGVAALTARAGDAEDCDDAAALLQADPARAVAACSKLAEQGDAHAEFMLGAMYQFRRGRAAGLRAREPLVSARPPTRASPAPSIISASCTTPGRA